MKKICVLLFCVMACRGKENAEVNVNDYADAVTLYANGEIIIARETRIQSLKQKLTKIQTKDSAEVYLPKAENAIQLADSAVDYLNRLMTIVGKKGTLDEKDSLFEKLKDYEANVLKIDAAINRAIFEKAILSIDTINGFNKMGKEQFYNDFLHNISKHGYIVFLNSLTTNILYNVTDIARYCDLICNYSSCGFTKYMPLITQNAKKLRPDETLEITAGVGYYSSETKPTVMINGKNISLDEGAVAVYKLRASKDSGRHTVPVKVSYIKPNGDTAFLEKEIEYFVE